jgi:hypothetical protein
MTLSGNRLMRALQEGRSREAQQEPSWLVRRATRLVLDWGCFLA